MNEIVNEIREQETVDDLALYLDVLIESMKPKTQEN